MGYVFGSHFSSTVCVNCRPEPTGLIRLFSIVFCWMISWIYGQSDVKDTMMKFFVLPSNYISAALHVSISIKALPAINAPYQP